MSKVINATCDATGKVTAEGIIVTGATVLSLGKKSSSGVLILDEEDATYIASSATDIKKLIEDTTAILQKVIEILTGLDAVTVSPGGQAANVALLTTLKTQFEATKDTLK